MIAGDPLPLQAVENYVLRIVKPKKRSRKEEQWKHNSIKIAKASGMYYLAIPFSIS